MAKRPTRGSTALAVTDSTVHPLFPNRGWDPLGEGNRRDQSYIRKVKPQSANQELLLDAIRANSLVLALGPAGTGKTYLAISSAVEALDASKVDRIVLSRPAIEAGESIGYLPGDMHEKMAPFLRPLYDSLERIPIILVHILRRRNSLYSRLGSPHQWRRGWRPRDRLGFERR